MDTTRMHSATYTTENIYWKDLKKYNVYKYTSTREQHKQD